MTVRRLIADMDDAPGACMVGFWTANPCSRPARWISFDIENEWRVCDKHRATDTIPKERQDLRYRLHHTDGGRNQELPIRRPLARKARVTTAD